MLVEIVFLSEQAAADLNQLWLKSDLGQFCFLDLIEDFNDGADRFVWLWVVIKFVNFFKQLALQVIIVEDKVDVCKFGEG